MERPRLQPLHRRGPCRRDSSRGQSSLGARRADQAVACQAPGGAPLRLPRLLEARDNVTLRRLRDEGLLLEAY
jgi:hypothetical protein